MQKFMRKFCQFFFLSILGLWAFILWPTAELAAAPEATLSGVIQLQGRSEHADITVRLLNGSFSTTDAEGNFRLEGLSAGTYLVEVEADLYLVTQFEITLTNGEVTLGSPVLLWGGDLNKDNRIDIADAALVGASFGQATLRNDINDDGQLNIQDLTIVGGNLGKTSFDIVKPDMENFVYLPLIFNRMVR